MCKGATRRRLRQDSGVAAVQQIDNKGVVSSETLGGARPTNEEPGGFRGVRKMKSVIRLGLGAAYNAIYPSRRL